MIRSDCAHVHFASLIAGVCGLLLAFMFGVMSYGVFQNASGDVVYNAVSGLLALASLGVVRGAYFVVKLPNLF